MKLSTWQALAKVSPPLVLVVLTLFCLLPFVGKAFHIDDPVYVWCAQHLRSHPFDFYGFNINWVGREQAVWQVTQNPPLVSYYMVLVGMLLGWNEVALHLGFLVPAVAAVIGTYFLSRQLCKHPFWASLVTLVSPVFLISSTSVMCDTMMLAFWVWSVFFWVEGLKSGNASKLCIASLLIAACSLTKYFGMCLIPLLLAYSAMERRRVGSWLAWLSVPVMVLGLYQWMTYRLYGRGLLLNAVDYATNLRVGGELFSKILAGLAFVGGCIVILILAAPLLWRAKVLVAGVIAMLLVGVAVVSFEKIGIFEVVSDGKVKWFYVAQLSMYAVAGAGLLWLAWADFWKEKTPVSVLLLLWVAGTFVFAAAVNWTVSGRSILPMLPAAAIVLIRRLELRKSAGDRNTTRLLTIPLAGSLAIALFVTQADYRLANSAREAVSQLDRKLGQRPNHLRFQGHWGFQYYMEQVGAEAIDRDNMLLSPTDVIVVPLGNSYLFRLPEDRVDLLFRYEIETSKWVTTMNGQCGAGYYSDGWGPLPYVFGSVFTGRYLAFRVK